MPNKIELQLQKCLELRMESSGYAHIPVTEYSLVAKKFILELCDAGISPVFINGDEITFIDRPPWADEDEIPLHEIDLRSIYLQEDGRFIDLFVDWPLFIAFTFQKGVQLALAVELELL